ncbi:hypothetical protein ACIGCK_04770 [Microbacterium sp. NPDC078428]|uniref:hypothetical protein n=1 Tax=Microbacterium sp. NPDC078428 TaxID=3364190 RepID=UPI0037C4F98C
MKNGSYEVVDDVFTYKTKRGATITIDFDFPVEVIAPATSGEAETEEEQFEAVAEWISEESRTAYETMGALERTRFLKTFYNEWAKAAELPLGESLSSSPS